MRSDAWCFCSFDLWSQAGSRSFGLKLIVVVDALRSAAGLGPAIAVQLTGPVTPVVDSLVVGGHRPAGESELRHDVAHGE